MSRLVNKSPAVCTDLPLDDSEIHNKLRIVAQLVKSSYGPRGRLKQVHNNIGGQVVTTSTSSVLLASISSSQPLVDLVITSIRNHVSRFSDCGLFAATLCLALIDQAKRSGLGLNVAMRVNKHLLGVCINYLRQGDCACKVKLDLCSSQSLITLSRSVVSSKPACVLTELEALHISKLSVQAFLLTVPCNSQDVITLGGVVTVSVEGLPVLDSAVFPGLLVDMPSAFDITMVGDLQTNPLRVALFSVSLAGDLAEVGDGTIEVHHGVDTDSQILDRLLELGERAVMDEVKLFACQKVIHPVLQQYLRSRGVFVIERLGVNLMEPLIQLTGAQPVGTLHTTVPPQAYGKVHDLRCRQFGSKTMLHLCPAEGSTICTMLLCHRNETMLSELKVVCQKSEHILRLALKEPFGLLGGGCTETHLAAYIRHQSTSDAAETAPSLGCSQTEYLSGADVFCRSLNSVAAALEHDDGSSLIDLAHAHHWSLPADVIGGHTEEENLGRCGCGLLQSGPGRKWSYLNTKSAEFSPTPMSGDDTQQPHVLDSFTAKLNALHVAVETANIVLDVRYIIQDVN